MPSISVVPAMPAPRNDTLTSLRVTVAGARVRPTRGAMSIVHAAVEGAANLRVSVAAVFVVTDPTVGGQVDDPQVRNAKLPWGTSEPSDELSTHPALGVLSPAEAGDADSALSVTVARIAPVPTICTALVTSTPDGNGTYDARGT